jgi:hypothetical protein
MDKWSKIVPNKVLSLIKQLAIALNQETTNIYDILHLLYTNQNQT